MRLSYVRMRNISQKFKTIKFLHKDKINSKIFETVTDIRFVVLLISILRCVICLVRRSRRIRSSLILKKTQIIINLHQLSES